MPLMDLIVAFSAFTLACSASLMLLPEGSVRRACVFAFGVLSVIIWLDGVISAGTQESPVSSSVYSPAESSFASLLEASQGLPDLSAVLAALPDHDDVLPISQTQR